METLQYYADMTEKYIFSETSCGTNEELREAMAYSLRKGKRIRPALLLGFCKAYGGDTERALPAAAALEYIHAYSLVHDDLPCMDDSDLRRGEESCHKKFGEATALLAGDSLLTEAFSLIVSKLKNTKDFETAIRAVKTLTYHAGVNGMIGGQCSDAGLEKSESVTEEEILQMYESKTGSLIKAACEIGCVYAEAGESAEKNAREYGKNLGIAFQITDDILDIEGNESDLGKPIGQDGANGKKSLPLIFGLERAKALAEKYTKAALVKLRRVPNSNLIKEFTKSLSERNT